MLQTGAQDTAEKWHGPASGLINQMELDCWLADTWLSILGCIGGMSDAGIVIWTSLSWLGIWQLAAHQRSRRTVLQQGQSLLPCSKTPQQRDDCCLEAWHKAVLKDSVTNHSNQSITVVYSLADNGTSPHDHFHLLPSLLSPLFLFPSKLQLSPVYTTISHGMPAFPAPLPRVFVQWSVRWFFIMLGHATSPPPPPPVCVCVCVFPLCSATCVELSHSLSARHSGELSNNKECVCVCCGRPSSLTCRGV